MRHVEQIWAAMSLAAVLNSALCGLSVNLENMWQNQHSRYVENLHALHIQHEDERIALEECTSLLRIRGYAARCQHHNPIDARAHASQGH